MDENDSEIDFKNYLEAKENEDFIVKAINSLKFIKSGQVRTMGTNRQRHNGRKARAEK